MARKEEFIEGDRAYLTPIGPFNYRPEKEGAYLFIGLLGLATKQILRPFAYVLYTHEYEREKEFNDYKNFEEWLKTKKRREF